MKDILIDVAKKAGNLLKIRFNELIEGKYIEVNEKTKNDFVTEIDIEVEEFIKSELENLKIPIVGEETEKTITSDTYIIVDPIDGTRNFMRKNPHFAVNIGLIEKGEPIIGITYDPIKDELFFAEREKGVYLNGVTRKVSVNDDLSKSIIALGLPYRGISILNNMMELYKKIYLTGSAIRHTGSAALDLAYVAVGRYDAMVEFFLSPWDILPGILMVREGGGKVGSINNKRPEEGWVIAGGTLYEKVYNIVCEVFEK
ncbi:MAG: inositol monophosphatase family protein [Thermosulfidibacteraceae bacterium]|jgi:myo-inositol-1(or 4)-monophosphatase